MCVFLKKLASIPGSRVNHYKVKNLFSSFLSILKAADVNYDIRKLLENSRKALIAAAVSSVILAYYLTFLLRIFKKIRHICKLHLDASYLLQRLVGISFAFWKFSFHHL